MVVPIVYFSYAKDEELLLLSLRAVDKLRQKYKDRGISFRVYVLDDTTNPISKPPANVVYMHTRFPRNGNLHGVECVAGMLKYYSIILELEKDAEFVIKCDCDTCINNIDKLLSANCSLVSSIGYGSDTRVGYGLMYAVSRAAVKEANKMINDNTVMKRILKACKNSGEDTITHEICRNIPGLSELPIGGGQESIALHYASSSDHLPHETVRQVAAVTFKKYTPYVKAGMEDFEREMAATRMRDFLEDR